VVYKNKIVLQYCTHCMMMKLNKQNMKTTNTGKYNHHQGCHYHLNAAIGDESTQCQDDTPLTCALISSILFAGTHSGLLRFQGYRQNTDTLTMYHKSQHFNR